MSKAWQEKSELLRVGVTNAAWLSWRAWVEFVCYGWRRWWWRTRCALWWGWLDTTPQTLVNEAQGKYASDDDLIYGETLPGTAYELLKRLQVNDRDIVVDLGCGRGAVTLVAALAFGAQSVGVDLLPGYIEHGARLVRVLEIGKLARFQEGDILKCDIPKGTVYFFAGTCLSAEHWQLAVRRLSAVAPVGARAVSLSQALPAKDWELISEESWPFSWGMATVYLHRRRGRTTKGR